MESERLTIKQVSEILGESEHAIRAKCQRNIYDPPICRVERGAKNKHYVFFRGLVERYVGKSLQELQ